MNLLNQFKEYLFSQDDTPAKVTVKNYISDVGQFIKWFESFTKLPFAPNQITDKDITNYQEFNKTELSPVSMQRHLSSLRKFFKFLKDESFIAKDPFEISALNTKAEIDPWKLKEFKNHLYGNNAAHLTIKNYIIDVKQFITWAKEVTGIEEELLINRVDKKFIEEYKSRLLEKSGFSPATINRKLSSLRSYASWAHEQGLLTENIISVENISKAKQKLYIPNPSDSPMNIRDTVYGIQNTKYSKFPPLRLFQKITRASTLAFDSMLIAPLAGAGLKLQNFSWKLKGQPIFTKGPQSLIKKNITHEDLLGIKNISKKFYAPFGISTKSFSPIQKLIFHARYTRPKWYKTYHSYAITHYFHFAVLVIFLAGLGFGLFNAFFVRPSNQNPALAALPTAPPRVLSFQGRLTDNNDNPITSNTNIRYAIYNDLSASGSALLWQEVVYGITPDTDGIFNSILGNNSAIPSTLFSENSALYLGVTIEATPELTPRQQLATVAYATNSETLQGLPPSTAAGAATSNVVLALDSSGNLTIGGSANPIFSASGGTFKLSGQPLLLTTNVGSNSNVNITTDGTGRIDLQKPIQNTSLSNNITTAVGSVEVDDIFSILATSSGQSALTINQNSTGPLISASTSGVAKFTVDNSGNETLAGNSTIAGTTGVTFSSTGGINLAGGTLVDSSDGVDIADALEVSGLITANGGLTVASGQTTTFANFTSNGGIFYGNGSGVLAQVTAGTAAQCLLGGTTPVFGACATGANDTIDTFWNQTNGALYPNNSTVDFLIGGQASSSANFSVAGTSRASGTNPIATVSGTTAQAVLVVNQKGVGDIFTASLSGTPKFTVGNGGDITIAGTTGVTFSSTGGINLAGGTLVDSSDGVDIADALEVSGLITANGGLTVASGQTTTFANFTSNGGIFYGNGSGVLAQVTAGTAAQCLLGGTTPVFGACATGANDTIDTFWNQTNGALYPNNSTVDFLIGGQASSSANFSVAGTSRASGTNPIATVSGTTAQAVLVVNQKGVGDIFTASLSGTPKFTVGNGGDITIAGTTGVTFSSTGGINLAGGTLVDSSDGVDIADALEVSGLITANGGLTVASGQTTTFANFTSNGGIFYGNGSGVLAQVTAGTAAQCLLGGTTPVFGACATGANDTIDTFWNQTNGALYPNNSTVDFLIGGQATTSAEFSFTGVSNLSNQTQASISGQLVVVPNNGYGGLITTANNLPLTISPNGTGALNLGTTNTGAVSIGNTTGDITLGADTITASSLATFTTAAELDFSGDIEVSGNDINSSTGATALTLSGSDVTIGGDLAITGGNITSAVTADSTLTVTGTLTANGILDANGVVTLGDNGDNITIDSNVWDVTAAGVASGLTGLSSSGTITFSGFNANNNVLYATVTTGLVAGANTNSTGLCLLSGASAPSWGSCTAGSADTADVWWNQTNGALYPNNSTVDFLVGGQASSSAKFAVLNVNSGTPIASIAGTLMVKPNMTGLVTGPIATITGRTNNAALVVNNEAQSTFSDLITASAAGVTKFIVNNTGDVIGTSFKDISNTAYHITPAASGTSLNLAGTTITASNLTTFTTAATLGMASTTTLNLGSNATLSSSATALNLEEDGGDNINIGGTSAATGCTVTNSTGAFACAAGGTFTTLALSGAITGATTIAASGAIAANGGITFDASTDTVGAHTLSGTLDANSNIITNIGSTGTDFDTSGGLSLTTDAAGTVLTLDNAANASSIFVAEDNNSAVFTIADGGNITMTGTLAVNGDSITADGATLTINAAGTIDLQDNVLADNLTLNANTGTAITISGTSFVDDILLQNGETIDNDTNGTILLTATTTQASGDLTIAGATSTLSFSSSTGTKTISTGGSTDLLISPGGQFRVGGQVFSTDIADIEGSPTTGGCTGCYVLGLGHTSTTNNQNILGIKTAAVGNSNTWFVTFITSGNAINGKIQVSGSGVSYVTTSDQRLKENIVNTHYSLSDLMKIKVRDYNWIRGGLPATGFIAQELYDAYSPAVALGGDDAKSNPWGVDYGSLTPLIIKSVQDQQLMILDSKSHIASMEADLSISNSGNLNVVEQNPGQYFVIDSSGGTINRISTFAQVVLGNLRAGIINTKDLTVSGSANIGNLTTNSLNVTADSVTIAGQSLQNFIVNVVNNAIISGAIQQFNNEGIISPIASIDEIHTNVISPLSTNKVVVKLPTNDKNSTFEVQNSSGSAVASIDATGNASLSGTLTSSGVNTTDATISGTLRAGRIIADQIEGLNIKASTISANYITNNYYGATESAFPTLPVGNPNASGSGNLSNLFAGNNYINIASYSSQFAYVDNLSAGVGTFSQGLMVFGTTTLSDTSIVGQLAINGSLILADNSINVLGQDLNLQPLRQGGLSIMAGLIYIDTNGNIKIGNDATINGTLFANEIAPLPNKDLNIRLASGSAQSKLVVKGASGSGVLTIDNFGNLIASGAASISKLNINNIVSPALAFGNDVNATGSAGTVTLKANKSEVTVNNKLVTENSLIYITPVGSTLGQNLYLVRQVADEPASPSQGGSFTVGISVAIPVDTKFNYLIIN